MKRLVFLVALFSLLAVKSVPRVDAFELASVKGKKYKIFIYAPFATTSISTVTFNEDYFLEFSAYEGTGLYLDLGMFFTGTYWAPDFYEKDDLILFMSGIVLEPYLVATGIAIINTDVSRVSYWIFQGHEIYQD